LDIFTQDYMNIRDNLLQQFVDKTLLVQLVRTWEEQEESSGYTLAGFEGVFEDIDEEFTDDAFDEQYELKEGEFPYHITFYFQPDDEQPKYISLPIKETFFVNVDEDGCTILGDDGLQLEMFILRK
jgi:hypothetical protein